MHELIKCDNLNGEICIITHCFQKKHMWYEILRGRTVFMSPNPNFGHVLFKWNDL